MALEVNFYAGTRALYDAEPSLDPGGLYALIDGLGLYRGAQPIAGPCPFDINLLIEKTSEQDKVYQLSGGFQSSESVQSIKEFFDLHPGNGGRPVRVKFKYTSGKPLNHVALDNVNLMMYNTVQFLVHNDTGLVGSFTAIEFKPRRIENELVDCVIYKLSLLEPDVFHMDIKEFSLSASDIPTSEIVASINENRDAIAAVSNNLNNEVIRAKNAESELQDKIDANKTEIDANTSNITKNAQDISDLTTKVNKNSSDITEIKTEISESQKKIEDNNAAITTLQTSVSNLDKRIDNIEAGGTGGPFWVEY